MMTMTLEKGGCSFGTQRVSTKQTGRRKSDYRTNRQENETLHFYGEGRSQILDTQTSRWQEHLDKVYGMVEDQRNKRNSNRRPNGQDTEETGRRLWIRGLSGVCSRTVRRHKMTNNSNRPTQCTLQENELRTVRGQGQTVQHSKWRDTTFWNKFGHNSRRKCGLSGVCSRTVRHWNRENDLLKQALKTTKTDT
jgi:hypothetical protein